MSSSRVKIVCLPCAGGSSTYFHRLRDQISSFADIVLIDYAGHGTRMDEALNDNLDELISDVSEIIKKRVQDGNYCILGYSMGSLIAYILAANPKYKIDPRHLFLFAFQSPNLLKEERFLVNKPINDDAFIERYSNIDQHILNDKRFERIFLDPLRNDYRILCSYQVGLYKPLSCKITAIFGEDDFSYSDIVGWNRYTANRTEVISMPGRHFFLNENLKTIGNLLKNSCVEQFDQ